MNLKKISYYAKQALVRAVTLHIPLSSNCLLRTVSKTYFLEIAEYGMGNEVSTYGDVYSYGVLLLEMFTGKRPTNDMFKDSLSLGRFVKAALPVQVLEIADPILVQEVEGKTSVNTPHGHRRESGRRIQECLASIFTIGVACSEEIPRERKGISNVVIELHSIRNKL